MAITLIGSNLLAQCGSGKFETDPSGWGVPSYSHRSLARSNEQKQEGLFSGKMISSAVDPNLDGLFKFHRLLDFGGFNVAAGKKYVMRGWVYSPQADPAGSDDVKALIVSINSGNVSTYAAGNSVNLSELIGTWKQIEYQFECTATGQIHIYLALSNHANWGGAGIINVDGIIYADNFSLYEFTDGSEEAPVVDAPESVYFVKNDIYYPVTASQANINEPNFSMYLEVYIEKTYGSNNFTKELALELPPDSNDQALFRLNDAFEGVFDRYLPNAGESNIKKVTALTRRFRVYFAEKYGDDPTLQALSESSIMQALSGGISKELAAELDFFETFLDTHKRFLTWQPNGKKVSRLQEEYLFFYFKTAPAGNKFKCKYYICYDDEAGTENLEEQATWTTGVTAGDIYSIPAGPGHGGINLYEPAKAIRKYQLFLVDGDGNQVSEIRSFQVDNFNHPNERFFMFENSLGGIDTLRTTGQGSKSSQVEFEISENILPYNYDVQQGQFRQGNYSMRNTYELSTGHLSKAYADYLQEFLMSPKRYVLRNGKRIPIVLDTKSFEISKDRNFRYYLRFEYKNVFAEEVYTPESYNESQQEVQTCGNAPKAWRGQESTAYCEKEY